MKIPKIKTAYPLIALFVLLIFLQHHYVYMYFDDYGYASLSYVDAGNTAGMSYGFPEIFHFLKVHYLNWGGRILYFFFEIVIFRIGGLGLMQFVQAVIITAICTISGKILSNLTDAASSDCVALMLFLYGTFQIRTLRDGIYWYSASILYVWPLLPLFGGIYIYLLNERKESAAKKTACIFLTFLAAFSQEQIAVLTITLSLLQLLAKYAAKATISFYHLAICASAFVGGAFIILAPGNFVRAKSGIYKDFYSENFLLRTVKNIAKIINDNVGFHNWIFVFILAVFCGTAIAVYFKKRKIMLVSIVFSICFLLIPFLPMRKIWGAITGSIWLLIFLPLILLYYFKQKKWALFMMLIAGLCSQAMMAVSPAVPLRCHVIMEFILHFILADCILDLYREFGKDKKHLKILKSATFLLAFYAACNMLVIIGGYKGNYDINQKNHETLLKAKEQYKAEQTVGEIILYKLNDDQYANMMPYQEGFRNIETGMKYYYELPQEAQFQYR